MFKLLFLPLSISIFSFFLYATVIHAKDHSLLICNKGGNQEHGHLWIEQVLKDVVEDMQADEHVFSQYFSPSFIQHVDGQTSNYQGFVQHMLKQKSILKSAKLTVLHTLTEGNKICTVHKVDAVKKDEKKISVKVIAYYELEDGKIVKCDELTYLLTGDEQDRNLGSIK